MKYMIEFELPDNDTVLREIKTADVAWGIWGYRGYTKAKPAQRWIPCSERLPRQGQEVICQCRANMIKVLKLDACGDWYQDAEHSYMSGFVIAWMPLPTPYREE